MLGKAIRIDSTIPEIVLTYPPRMFSSLTQRVTVLDLANE